MLGELSLPPGAAHAEVFEGSAEAGELVPLQVRDTDQRVGLDDVGADMCVIKYLSPNGDGHGIVTPEPVGDD